MLFFNKITYLNNSRKKEIESFLNEWNDDGEFIVSKSSGSTGEAKTIRLYKKHIKISAQKTIDHFQIKKGGKAYLCLSTETIAGKMMIVRSLINEMELIVGPVTSNSLELINEIVDLVAVVPIQLETAVDNSITSIKKIKTLLVGGAPVSSELEKKIIDAELTYFHTYGMTETISHVAIKKSGVHADSEYKALPGITFSVLKDNSLVIHYPEIDQPNLETNDIVEFHSPSSFEWIGRKDFIINSGGIKMNPEQIEARISSLIPYPFIIGGKQDELLGQKLVLILETEERIDFDINQLKSRLNKFELPREIFTLPSFIRTKSDKINRLETLKLIP